eukprot:1251230-Prymnesium_polylepis.2
MFMDAAARTEMPLFSTLKRRRHETARAADLGRAAVDLPRRQLGRAALTCPARARLAQRSPRRGQRQVRVVHLQLADVSRRRARHERRGPP